MEFEPYYFVYLMGLKDGLSSGMSLDVKAIQDIIEEERNKVLEKLDNHQGTLELAGYFKDESRNKAIEAIRAVAKKQMEERQKKFVEAK